MRRICFCIFFCIVLLCFSACSVDTVSKNQEIIDETAVTSQEIDYFKNRLKSDIINEFAAKYNIEDFSDFWNTIFGGESPADVLTQRAEEEARFAKKQLLMMKEYGIYDDISYSALKYKAETYNDTYKNSQSHVGLNSINMDSFYTYYIENGMLDLVNIYYEETYVPSEEKIEQYRALNNTDDNISDIAVEKKICEEEIISILENYGEKIK